MVDRKQNDGQTDGGKNRTNGRFPQGKFCVNRAIYVLSVNSPSLQDNNRKSLPEGRLSVIILPHKTSAELARP